MSALMRAKMEVAGVKDMGGSEDIVFRAVCRNEGYPDDGSDENNTYARFSPTADLHMVIANPALFGKLEVGQQFYVDFTKAE
ncbi:hypothetical protein [Mariprofundus ferrooxydans]|uniref:hypothetical protein n=1 Tax=Mariprofundus ferrooxydans TaxID=314344 RepID=UPI00197EB851|nr:hypothetical protein [Mariprofundus ferrooxydans]